MSEEKKVVPRTFQDDLDELAGFGPTSGFGEAEEELAEAQGDFSKYEARIAARKESEAAIAEMNKGDHEKMQEDLLKKV